MRPLKLTLTAFGPYHETEVINFEALKPYDLFVISGNTGAGKTSIFDGISYALFGGASGEDRREPLFLRSDFAADHLPTTAELIFSLRGKTYRIFRQLPYLKTGNKSLTPGKAELYQINLDSADLFAELSIVDRQITSEVDRKIFELIGLNKAQFNQLIMLPQGEYQRFLTSTTNEKEAILRTVFNTEKYQTLIQSLKVRRDEQHQRVLRLRATQTQLLQSLFTQLPVRDSLLFSYQETNEETPQDEPPRINPQQALNGLSIESAYYEQHIATVSENIQEHTHEIKALQTTIAQAKLVNDAFEQLATTKQALDTHQQAAASMQALKKRIELAEQAQPIEKPFETVTRLREDAKKALTELKQSESQLKAAHIATENAQQQYKLEVAKEAERTALAKEIAILESNQARIESFAKLQDEAQSLTQSITTLNTQLTAQKTAISQKNREKEQCLAELQSLEQAAMPAFPLSQLSQKLTGLHALVFAQDTRHNQVEALQLTVKRDQAIAEKAQQQLDQTAQNWLLSQSQLLAQALQSGDQCPVCGSTEHPALQASSHHSANHPTLSSDTTEQQLAQAQKAAITANAQYQQSQLQWQHLSQEIAQQQPLLQAQFDELRHFLQSEEALPLADLALIKTPEADFIMTQMDKESAKTIDTIPLTALETFIAQSNQSRDMANQSYQQAMKLREALKATEITLAQLQASFDKQQESLRELDKALTTKTVEIDSITAMIPAELQDITRFQHNLQSQKARLSTLNAALETAQQNKIEQEQQLAVMTHQVTHEQLQVDTFITAGKKARIDLDAALQIAGFTTLDENDNPIADESAFINARLESAEIKKLRETTQQYEKQLDLYQQQIKMLEATLKTQTVMDLSRLQEALQAQEASLTELNQTLVVAKHALKMIQQAQLNIAENRDQLETESDHLHKVMEVHDLLRGENTQKLSFERFILIAYFEQIIEAANLRLQKMTHGQFEFIRSESLASHGKQSGLDLDIYDAYTGEARDVKTLSGGEKFKASLSLSLGMADTIQAHQGGISIDTLFIDEGFGSLDEESLLQALDVLIELQNSGKMIGIISHVEELKQTLPARIEVTKSKGGFSTTQIITQDSLSPMNGAS